MNGIEFKDKKKKMDTRENDVSELIEALKNQGRILKKLQKELGIEEFSIPIIGGEEN